MNKHYKLFVIFALIMIGIFAIKLTYDHKATQKIKELSIQYEAESIADFLVAFRNTYQDIFIRNHATLNVSNIDFLPVKTTNEIAKIFSELNTKSKIATVSDRPRNPENLANKRQLEVIKYFVAHKDKKSFFQTIGEKHYYSQPLYISQKCLSCHGKREDAPQIINENYSAAYDYQLGDLRGIIDIEVRQSKLSLLLEENQDKTIFFVLILLSLILSTSFLYARYHSKLSKLVFETSLALERANHTLEDRVQDEIAKNRAKDQKLFQQSRMAQMGELLSMIAHQWRQPLGSIAATVSNIEVKMSMDKYDLETKEGAQDCKKFLDKKLGNIDSYVQNLSTTIDDFRNFYNPNKESTVGTINAPIHKALDIIKSSLRSTGIEVLEKYESTRSFSMAEGELMQVFLNIFKNAQDNFKEKGSINPKIFITSVDTSDGVEVYISDNGGGIPEAYIAQVFDPYFSTKNKKNGTGLGLYMSKIIIQEHHDGKLSVNNRYNGAEFVIYIRDREK